jgi:protein pelota
MQQVSGVAAILRYPLPDLDELEELAQEHVDNEGRGVPEDGGEEEEYDPNRRINEDVHGMGFK